MYINMSEPADLEIFSAFDSWKWNIVPFSFQYNNDGISVGCDIFYTRCSVRSGNIIYHVHF